MNADRTDPAAALLAAFGEQAQRRPRAEALRVQRHGVWLRFSWSELAVRASRAAAGWAALGVGRGDTIVAIGALSESFIVSSIAARLLGAEVRTAPDASLDRDIAEAVFVLAQGTREVDRVLMHRPPSLRVIVVENEFGTEPAAHVTPVGWDALIESGSVPASTGTAPPAEATQREAAETVLADFPIHWPTGIRWLTSTWTATGATLVVVEPNGDADVARREARPDAWIACTHALAAFDASARERIPSRGIAAWLVGAAFSEAPGILRAALRARLRNVLGLRATRRVLTDADASPASVALLRQLGIAVEFDAPHPLEAARPRVNPSHGWVEPLEPVMDRVAQ